MIFIIFNSDVPLPPIHALTLLWVAVAAYVVFAGSAVRSCAARRSELEIEVVDALRRDIWSRQRWSASGFARRNQDFGTAVDGGGT